MQEPITTATTTMIIIILILIIIIMIIIIMIKMITIVITNNNDNKIFSNFVIHFHSTTKLQVTIIGTITTLAVQKYDAS